MRTDVTIDNRAIPCPNAGGFGGGGHGRAKAGHCILYRENHADGTHSERLARVLGRISAAGLNYANKPVKGFALVMALSNDASFAYERWVDPADIVQVFDVPNAMAAFFFAPKLAYDAATMRRLMDYGTVSNRYVAMAPDHVAEWNKEGIYL